MKVISTLKYKNANLFSMFLCYADGTILTEKHSCCWLVRGSLFIELGCPEDLGKRWRGDLGTFMISRPI